MPVSFTMSLFITYIVTQHNTGEDKGAETTMSQELEHLCLGTKGQVQRSGSYSVLQGVCA